MDKIERLLLLYTKLITGEQVNKTLFCFEYECSPRTFERDIETIRLYLSDSFSFSELIYDRVQNTYYLAGAKRSFLEPMEYLLLEHLLYDSSVLRKDEFTILLQHLLEMAIKTGADTSIKTVIAGTLQVAIRKGIIRFIPKGTPAGVIANVACVGIENVKVLVKVAKGELSVTKGLDQMGRVTVSMVGGLCGMAEGAAIGASMTGWIPVVGPALAVATGFVGGMVGYFGGSKIGDAVYSGAKKVASAAEVVGSAAWKGIKNTGRSVWNAVKEMGRKLINS